MNPPLSKEENEYEQSKRLSKYVLMSVALLQSELYWICSVLYCMFRESGFIEDQKIPVVKRIKPNTSIVKLNPHLDVLIEHSDEENASGQVKAIGIRPRPTVVDELNGTTCPPIWWQKTRVKLGRTPVHGDAKSVDTSRSNSLSQSSSLSLSNSLSSSENDDDDDSSSSSSSSTYTTKSQRHRRKQFFHKLNNALHNIHHRRHHHSKN